MSTELIISFCLVALLSGMVPGPNGLLIVSHSLTLGRRTALITLSGTLCAFYAHGLFSVVGISALIMSSSELFMLVKALGVAYLCYLGITSLWQAINSNRNVQKKTPQPLAHRLNYKKAWLQGFITNLLNPKVSMFYLALFPQFLSESSDIVTTTFFLVTVQIIIVGCWFASLALLAHKTVGLGKPMLTRLLKGGVGVLMLWFGVKLAKVQTSA
ncbi:LysE family translocator [Corallincola spongiicola]|uniref:LysE family translocator n=1 Tax=Corallincola spongiicola TaxID=2520508 RepID=A0ABY1WTJ1_9GAMM|nr:LysE family translocator [Corallincola spongiicola]TAA47842.1 LysE family translocator [Corallincola spongiicola]